MGSSISKSNRSSKRLSFSSLKSKKSVSSFFCLEPSDDDQSNKKLNRKKSRASVTKSIIGKPTDFIHLNHAGLGYGSLGTLFPLNQTIAISNTNYALDHSYHSVSQKIDQEIKTSLTLRPDDLIKSVPERKQLVLVNGSAGHHQNNALFSEQLYDGAPHKSIILPGYRIIGTAY